MRLSSMMSTYSNLLLGVAKVLRESATASKLCYSSLKSLLVPLGLLYQIVCLLVGIGHISLVETVIL